MQSLHGNCLIAYARHKYILTMVNGEYRYFNGGDLVFADASQIRVDKCVENFVLVSRDTLSLFLPMLKEEALNLHAHKKISSLLVHHCSRDIPVFRKLRNYRRIRIFAMQKCYVKSINLCVVICFS